MQWFSTVLPWHKKKDDDNEEEAKPVKAAKPEQKDGEETYDEHSVSVLFPLMSVHWFWVMFMAVVVLACSFSNVYDQMLSCPFLNTEPASTHTLRARSGLKHSSRTHIVVVPHPLIHHNVSCFMLRVCLFQTSVDSLIHICPPPLAFLFCQAPRTARRLSQRCMMSGCINERISRNQGYCPLHAQSGEYTISA